MGMLHPSLAGKLDLDGNPFLFELDMAPLSEGVLPAYTQISRFPGIRRDIAIVIDESISYAAVADCIRSVESELLRNLLLFDVYTGANIDSGRKSLALGLILQSSSQTLTDEVVDGTIERVLARLQNELGARLRD